MKVKLTVGTTPVRVDLRGAPVVQNLGPGVLYLGTDNTVDANTGMRVVVNQAYEFAKPISLASGSLWIVSSGTSDVRVLEVG